MLADDRLVQFVSISDRNGILHLPKWGFLQDVFQEVWILCNFKCFFKKCVWFLNTFVRTLGKIPSFKLSFLIEVLTFTFDIRSAEASTMWIKRATTITLTTGTLWPYSLTNLSLPPASELWVQPSPVLSLFSAGWGYRLPSIDIPESSEGVC